MFRSVTALVAVCALTLALLAGCSGDPSITAPPEDSAVLRATATFTTVEGVLAGGAHYGLFMPDEWNGDLVLMAHGYVSPWDYPDPYVPEEMFPWRDALLEAGYGVAWSSYRENGWAVKEGMIATHQLKGVFTSHFGPPDDTYVMGLSMGGLIAVYMAERYPDQYAGALSMAGVVGGAEKVAAYVCNMRALFDYYYPGVLPGGVLFIPPDMDTWESLGAAMEAMMTNPAGLMELGSVEQLDLRYNDVEELFTAVWFTLWFQLHMTNELVGRVNGSPFDNSEVWYSGTSDDEALNAGIGRYIMKERSRNYLAHYYEPKGNLQTPVMTLHFTRDPIVHITHEEEYAQVVAAAGCSEMLRQTFIDRFEHGGFTTAEFMTAFNELVAWSESLGHP